MNNNEYDEWFDYEFHEKSEENEWFQDDCRERARDMREYCK